jgi:hypothetical protein
VEKMKYYTFKRESNDFSDILKDPALKELIKLKIKWKYHLMIGLSNKAEEGTYGYIVLKYGEEIVNPINKDYTPIPGVDYTPKRN